jgi:rhodanese-related sulfurtransferase
VLDADEIAVVDVREGDRYASGHISVAVGLPFSEIELRAALLLPRGSVRIVVTDDNGASLAPAAAARLQALEYRNVRVLEGELQAWKVEGNELITGLNSLSKALGEFVERRYHTPRIMAGELRDLIASGEDIVVLDTRPLEEFNHISIPASIAAPGRGTVMSRVRRGAVTGHPSRRQLRRAYPSHYRRAGADECWCPQPGRIAAERNHRLAAGGIGTGSWRHHAGNHTSAQGLAKARAPPPESPPGSAFGR